MPTVYITAPTTDAGRLATDLVEHRLAACVNRISCRSTYRWEGDVIDEDEVILLAKTTEDRYPALKAHVSEHHPYDTPCIERFDEADCFGPFDAWIRDSCQPS